MTDKKELKWSAPEFEHFEKDVSWHWLVVIATIVLVTFSLWQKNFLFAIFLTVAAMLILVFGRQKPRYVDFHLTERGLLIDEKKLYPYEELMGFATRHLDSDDGLAELVFKRKHRLSTYLKVLLPKQHLEEIRVFINQYLPEVEYEESLTDHLSRLLKF